MKKIIYLLPIILLLIITIATSINYINLDVSPTSQIKLLENGKVAYAEDNITITWADNEGTTKTITTTTNAETIINNGTTDEETNNIYYYNQTHIITVWYGNTTTTAKAYAGITNGTLVAVTDDYYIFTLNYAQNGNTYAKAINKNTLADAPNNYLNNSLMGGAEFYTASNSFRAYAQAIYDTNSDYIILPKHEGVPASSYYLTYIKIMANSTGEPKYVNRATDSTNKEDIELRNDACTGATKDGDFYAVCTGGVITTYKLSTNTINDHNYGADGYTSGAEAYDDEGYAVTKTGDYLHLFKRDGTDNWVLPSPAEFLSATEQTIYNGTALELVRSSATSWARIGDTYIINDGLGGYVADTSDLNEVNFYSYAKRVQDTNLWEDDYWTGGNMALRFTGLAPLPNGTLVTPPVYNPWPAQPDSWVGEQAVKGWYSYVYPPNTQYGSVTALKGMYMIENNAYNQTFYAGTICDYDGHTAVYKEEWVGTDQEINDTYHMTNFDTEALGTSYPLSDYDEEETEAESSNYLVVTGEEEIVFNTPSGTTGSIVTHISHETEGETTIELQDKFGATITTLTATMNDSENTYIVTLNGETILSTSASSKSGINNEVVISQLPTGVAYRYGLLRGFISGSNTVDIRKVTITIDGTGGEASIGQIAFYNEAVEPRLQATTYIGTDNNDYTYYEWECNYDDEYGERTVKHYGSYDDEDYGTTVTWTYDYSASYNNYELITNGTIAPLTDEEGIANIQALTCSTLGICNSNGRMLFAVFVMIAILIATMHALNDRFHQTTATQSIPFLLFALLFIVFSAFGFFPTWFIIIGAMACAVVIATKFSFFNTGGASRGGE